MTPKQQRFVAEYLIDLNATQAAIRSGYSAKTANRAGHALLTKSDIASAVETAKGKQLATADLSAARVLEELRRLAFTDMREFFDANGNMKPMCQLTDEQGSQLASLEVIIKNAKAGDGVTDEIHKFKIYDKTRALEMLAKHFALLTEVVRVDAGDAQIATLMAGRQRAAAARQVKEAA